MITPATLRAILDCVAPEHLSDAGYCVHFVLLEYGLGGELVVGRRGLPKARRVFRALDTLNDLEELGERIGKGRIPFRSWRALNKLRAFVGRGRPCVHFASDAYLCDDDSDGDPAWWGPIGAREAANTNMTEDAREAVAR